MLSSEAPKRAGGRFLRLTFRIHSSDLCMLVFFYDEFMCVAWATLETSWHID